MNHFYEDDHDDDGDEDEDDEYDGDGFNFDNDHHYYSNYDYNRGYLSNGPEYGNAEVYGIDFHPIDVPKLADLASLTMALTILNYTYQQKEIELKLIEKLPIPVSISEYILEYTSSMNHQFQEWIRYNVDENHICFGTTSASQIDNTFQGIIWYPSGVINLTQTAKNFITSSTITDSDKFRLMCLYCMKDELESMWPSLVSKNAVDIVAETPLLNNILNYYWTCHFKNELMQINQPQALSKEMIMFRHPYVNNWPAKEYFFDHMTQEEQIQATIWCIDESYTKLQNALLRKLDEEQRLHVYLNRAVKIMSNYADEAEFQYNEEDIRSFWFTICNLITREDFVLIFKCLLESNSVSGTFLENVWFTAAEDFKRYILKNHREVIGSVLHLLAQKNENELFFKMLLKSSTDVKKNITIEPFFIQCSIELIRNNKLPLFDRLLNFCLDNPEDRKQFRRDLVKEEGFIIYCEQLIIEDMLQLLDQLLHLFLSEEEGMTKFKQNLSRQEFFGKHCEHLITEAEFHRFDRLLNSFVVEMDRSKFRLDLLTNSKEIEEYCLRCYALEKRGCLSLNNLLNLVLPSSPDFIAEYKKNLLMSSEGINQCASIINLQIDLNPVIMDSLPKPDLAAEFKKRLVFSPPAIGKFRELIVHNHSYELDLCIDRYITSDGDKIALKKQIIGNSVDLVCEVFRENSDETSWQSLMWWWPRDKTTPIDFRSILPLDEIFNEMLKYCIYSRYDPAHQWRNCILRSDPRLDSLDRFLKWYFESSMKITEYKLKRIDAYKEIEAITTLLTRPSYGYLEERDITYLKTVFNWIFENNSQIIAEFKVKKKGENIVKMLKYVPG